MSDNLGWVFESVANSQSQSSIKEMNWNEKIKFYFGIYFNVIWNVSHDCTAKCDCSSFYWFVVIHKSGLTKNQKTFHIRSSSTRRPLSHAHVYTQRSFQFNKDSFSLCNERFKMKAQRHITMFGLKFVLENVWTSDNLISLQSHDHVAHPRTTCSFVFHVPRTSELNAQNELCESPLFRIRVNGSVPVFVQQ